MIPDHILALVGSNLHHKHNHPIWLIKKKIETFFSKESKVRPIGTQPFKCFDNFSPFVNPKANFDDLLIPKNHPSRKITDTFYKDSDNLLRTHTSAHQTELLKKGFTSFLVFGDCYRKDTVDASHYPVFHQVEGVLIASNDTYERGGQQDSLEKTIEHLMKTLEACMQYIFSEKLEFRWLDDYFPFTNPSWELEIKFNDTWLEVLGCGIIQQQILKNCGYDNCTGWAFGIGLERLAMILYQIPDIRLFWSKDSRFLNQFKNGDAIFVPYSKYPPVIKDISFWVGKSYHENQFYELVRETGGDLVEIVEVLDDFVHPKTSQRSLAYRMIYRSMDRSLTNEEINVMQEDLREKAQSLDIILR